jgi:AcrR family transcriptional regulator
MHETKLKILVAAVKIAEKTPLFMVSRGAIAKRAKVPPSLISFHTGTMEDLRDAIVARAVEEGNAAVVMHAMAANHAGVKNAPKALIEEACKLLQLRSI